MAGFAQAFLALGRAPEVGELFQLPCGSARAAGHCRHQRGDALSTEGEIARSPGRVCARSRAVSMTVADLASYQPEWVTPISAQTYRGYTLHEIPPNGQGIAALIALGILSHFDLASLPVDGPRASQHLQIEAMKLAFADVYRYVSPNLPPWRSRPSRCWTTPTWLARAPHRPRRAQDFQAGNPVKGGTIYLTAADENGMMVSFIQSNYMGFGSGCVEPHFWHQPAEPRATVSAWTPPAPTWWHRASGPSTPSFRPS
jgi:gamma-glutamyltranspeptidase/glutathione hydrolase